MRQDNICKPHFSQCKEKAGKMSNLYLAPPPEQTSLACCFFKSILSTTGCFYLAFKKKIFVKNKTEPLKYTE